MDFNDAFHAIAKDVSPTDREGFRRQLNREWIEQRLAATATAMMRRR
jgi:hypothetical protein